MHCFMRVFEEYGNGMWMNKCILKIIMWFACYLHEVTKLQWDEMSAISNECIVISRLWESGMKSVATLTTSSLQWCHMSVMAFEIIDTFIICSKACSGKHNKKQQSSTLPALCAPNALVRSGFLPQRSSNMESVSMLWHHCDMVQYDMMFLTSPQRLEENEDQTFNLQQASHILVSPTRYAMSVVGMKKTVCVTYQYHIVPHYMHGCFCVPNNAASIATEPRHVAISQV